MILNLSMVIAQTLGIKLTMKVPYLIKIEAVLFVLIGLMVTFPVIIEYPTEDLAWILSIVFLVFIGNYTYE